jgi:2-keto-4-pentenoate hydratase
VLANPVKSMVWLADGGEVELKQGDLVIAGAFCKLKEYYKAGDTVSVAWKDLPAGTTADPVFAASTTVQIAK